MIGHMTVFLELILSSGTDRRMTAHVLGTKPKLDNKQDDYRKKIPILQIGKDDRRHDEIIFGSRYQ